MQGFARDIFWAYTVSFARVASWVVVYGVLFRRVGPDAAALLALVRWTLGLVNYASAGLGPAILHHAAKGGAARESTVGSPAVGNPSVLDYAAPQRFSPRAVYHNGIALSWAGTAVGLIVLWGWALSEGRARGVATLVALFGTGMLIDLAADAWGAVIQSRGVIRRDYQAQTTLETLWAVLAGAALLFRESLGLDWQAAVGGAYLVAAVISAGLRAYGAARVMRALPRDGDGWFDRRVIRELVGFGGLVVLAQIADYLYAPTDFLLIRALIDLKTVAVYAPAVQMDAGIFLLVGGLSTVLLPMSARAFGQGDVEGLRRYYVRGTLVSLGLLVVTCALAYLAAPGIFRLWLGDKMRPTRAILPLVFVHTVIGGSSAVGRSVLLAMGKVTPFTAAALVAGVANVVLSYCFVRFGGMGLKGIILGTIVVVVARCGVWMPWYVLRVTRGGA